MEAVGTIIAKAKMETEILEKKAKIAELTLMFLTGLGAGCGLGLTVYALIFTESSGSGMLSWGVILTVYYVSVLVCKLYRIKYKSSKYPYEEVGR